METDLAAADTAEGLAIWIQVAYYTAFFVLGLGSTALIARRFRTWRALRRPLTPWTLSWVDFFLFLWVAFALAFVAGMVGLWVARRLTGTPEGETPPLGVFGIVSGVIMHGGFIGLFFAWRGIHRGTQGGPVDTRALGLPATVGYAVVLLLAAFPFVGLVSTAWQLALQALADAGLPVAVETQDTVRVFAAHRDQPWIFLPLAFVAVVLAPIAEELVFRGGVYRFLLGKMPMAGAIVVSSLLFGSLHLSLFGVVPLALLGAVLCLAYDLTGNIRVPIVLHMLFNLHTVLLLWLVPEAVSQL